MAGDGDVRHAGEGVGGDDGVDLGADQVAGPSSASAIRAMDEPITRASCTDVSTSAAPEGLQPLEDADRLEVEVGERPCRRRRRRGTRGPARSARACRSVDAGELGDLHPGVAAPRRHEHAIRHEEVDDVVGDGLVDLFLGRPVR